MTVTNRVTAIEIFRNGIAISIKIKKIMTPRLMSQNAAFLNIKNALLDSTFMNENMSEKVIKETGKENPRKKNEWI